jgi:hypothetical protein
VVAGPPNQAVGHRSEGLRRPGKQRVIDGLLYQLGYARKLPFLADSSDLLNHLRGRRPVVVCGEESVYLVKQVTHHHNHHSNG